IRHGEHLTHVSIVTDPVYLTEPLIKSQDFVLNPRLNANWLWPCEYVVEVATREKGAVPHYLPGTNQFNKEFRDKHKIPEIAQRAGADTMYPEFRPSTGTQVVSAVLSPNRLVPVPADNGVHIYPVQANVYLLTTPGGNMAVQAGKDGVLLVDTGTGKLTNE